MVLLWVVLLEEIATYKLRQQVADPYVRTAAILVFYGVGFALAATHLDPWLTRLFARARTRSKRGAGAIGLWSFYGLAYGVLFAAFYVMETRGVAALLPPAWR
jgi:hypothetical protein